MKKMCYVSVIGKTNAGKSSLINTLVGSKVAIVSPKAQTTRNSILGIVTKDETQYVFIDTPGIHKSKNILNKMMMKQTRGSLENANVVMYMIDGTKKFEKEELDYIVSIAQKEIPVVVVISKIDICKPAELYEKMGVFNSIDGINDFVLISAKQHRNIEELYIVLNKYSMPIEQYEYDEDDYTDKSIRFMVGEIIREKALKLLDEEIPHGVAVNVKEFEENENITNITAEIYCEKDSHKNIIIGKGGQTLKQIGSYARQDIENLLNCHVMLSLWVKVKPDWQNNTQFLKEIGLM